MKWRTSYIIKNFEENDDHNLVYFSEEGSFSLIIYSSIAIFLIYKYELCLPACSILRKLSEMGFEP